MRYQLFIDDLPNATMVKNEESDELEASFKEGIFVGTHHEDGAVTINNHLAITVKTHHVTGGDEVRVVGFEVEPKSVASTGNLAASRIDNQPMEYLVKAENSSKDVMGP